MVECVRGLDDIAKLRRFRLLRPQKSIKESAKDWWLYAARCHGYLLRDRHYSKARTLDDIRYIELYTRTLINPNETLSIEDKDLKDKVEKERYYDNIIHLREYCFQKVPSQSNGANSSNQNRGMLSQWFPQWWYSNASKPPAVPEETPVTPETPNDESSRELQFEDEILNALAKDAVDSNSLFKRDAVFGKFDFTLKKGTLDICTGTICNDRKSVIQLFFENLLLNVESRPRSGSHFIGLSLGTVLLKDHLTPNTEFPDLIKPQFSDESSQLNLSSRGNRVQNQRGRTTLTPQSSNSSTNQIAIAEPLFVMNYERKPLSYNTDYRLYVKSQSLDVVYNTGEFKKKYDM